MKPFLFVAACALTTACAGATGGNTPTEALGKKALIAEVDSGRTSHIRPISFKKIDGQALEVQGVKAYVMDFEAEFEFLDSGPFYGPFKNPGSHLRWKSPEVGQAQGRMLDCDLLGWVCSVAMGTAANGTRVTTRGKIVFELKESGWNAKEFEYKATPVKSAGEKQAEGQAAAVQSSDNSIEEKPVASMKTDLRNLITAQETYFSDNNSTYAPSIASMGSNYKASSGVTVTMGSVTKTGWAATATQVQTAKTCTMTLGGGSTVEGTPICK